MKRLLLALIFAVGNAHATASTIYKCTDENGGTLISNTRLDKSCKPVVTAADTVVPPPAPRAKGATANPSPAGFPKVAEDTQKARDTDRRRILEQELAAEHKGLDQAKRDLSEQEGLRGDSSPQRTLDRLQPYKDRVAQHERNIEAINKELANLK